MELTIIHTDNMFFTLSSNCLGNLYFANGKVKIFFWLFFSPYRTVTNSEVLKKSTLLIAYRHLAFSELKWYIGRQDLDLNYSRKWLVLIQTATCLKKSLYIQCQLVFPAYTMHIRINFVWECGQELYYRKLHCASIMRCWVEIL